MGWYMILRPEDRKKAEDRGSSACDRVLGPEQDCGNGGKRRRHEEDLAVRLRMQAKELQSKARLEDLTIRHEPLIKRTKKGWKKTYYRWVTSWREEKRYRKIYLGSLQQAFPRGCPGEGQEDEGGSVGDQDLDQ